MHACSGLLRWWCMAIAVLIAITPTSGARAQQSTLSNWPAATDALIRPELQLPPTPNITEVPRSPTAKQLRPSQPIDPSMAQVTLVALLTHDGQKIESGLVWRVYDAEDSAGPQKNRKLVITNRDSNPSLRLPPGDYIVNAAFGRAHLTRRISAKAGIQSIENFVLNAGGLRVAAVVDAGMPAPPNSVSYDIFTDERDQFGNRTKVVANAKPGVIVRLNSGIYHLVSTYGDANAHVSADVTVEAGKLTEATVAHTAGKITFKLVTRVGGEALADTQWSILDPKGDVVKESVGALPTHILAPGKYTVTARSGGRVFRREFAVQPREITEVEVVMQ